MSPSLAGHPPGTDLQVGEHVEAGVLVDGVDGEVLAVVNRGEQLDIGVPGTGHDAPLSHEPIST
jgi:hypothetical protein